MDGGLLLVIAAENISGGMGTAAFVALLMALCNQRFTATQFALLSAFASVGRVWVGPLAGVLAEAIGWPHFFVVSTVAGGAGAGDVVADARASACAGICPPLSGPPHDAGVGRCLEWPATAGQAGVELTMDSHFHVHDVIAGAPSTGHHLHCRCAQHARRRFSAALIAAAGLPATALAQTIPECKRSGFTKMVSAQQVEQAATQQYRQMLQQASNQKALGPKDHPQVVRLRAIAQRIIPYTSECNPDAKNWQWEVNLLGSQELNAFCMPGGKIAFYYGILSKLQLDDDEVAAIMGHEISHALLEHARERMGKTSATQLGIGVAAALLGLGSTGRAVGDIGGQLLTLSFSREDESEADALG